MGFDEQSAGAPRNLDGHVDETYRRADGNQRIQCRQILRVHANAAIRCSRPYRHRFVGAVNFVRTATKAESHFEVTDGIVRAGADHARQRIAERGMFVADGLRRNPGRMFDFLYDMSLPEGRSVSILANAYDISDDPRHSVFGGFRKIVEP